MCVCVCVCVSCSQECVSLPGGGCLSQCVCPSQFACLCVCLSMYFCPALQQAGSVHILLFVYLSLLWSHFTSWGLFPPQ